MGASLTRTNAAAVCTWWSWPSEFIRRAATQPLLAKSTFAVKVTGEPAVTVADLLAMTWPFCTNWSCPV